MHLIKHKRSLTTVGQLLDIVASPDFTSGPSQVFMLPLKSFALSFGLIGKDDKTIDNITGSLNYLEQKLMNPCISSKSQK